MICLNLFEIYLDFSERSEDLSMTERVPEDVRISFKMKTINTIKTTASAPQLTGRECLNSTYCIYCFPF